MRRCNPLAKIAVLACAVVASAVFLGGSQAAPTFGSGHARALLPNFAAQGANLIRLQAGAFDPLSDLKPAGALPRLASDAALPSGTAQYWLLQVESSRFAQARQAVKQAGGKVAGVVPDATFLVRATPAQKARIASSPAVRWIGYFQPSWRMPVATRGLPGLLDLEGTQTYRVYVFGTEPNPSAVGRALKAIPGVKVVDDERVVVDVKATAAQVPAIAAIPGVEWVSVKPTIVLMNSNARWVNDTGIRDVYAATAPGRLTGAGQTAGVADTAINYIYDLNGRAHVAFRDCNSDGTGCKLAEYIQTTPGSSTAAVTGITQTGTSHRKVVAFFDLGASGPNPYDESTHGSHTSGSVTGDAPPYGTWNGDDGMAPAAKLVSQNIGDTGGGLGGLPGGIDTPAEIAQLYRQAYRPRNPASVLLSSGATGNVDYYCVEGSGACAYRNLEDARTHNNSWGSIVPIVDTGQTVAINKFVWDHEDFTIVFSAGNDGPDSGSVHEPGDGKNYFSSGASANGRQPMASIDSMAVFSSHGPTTDGRFGPTVATPGQIVVSVKGGTVSGYHTAQGTSMSAPVLTGLLTLVRQYFFDGYGPGNFGLAPNAPGGGGFAGGFASQSRRHNPSAALTRAAVVNGAVRMRGWYSGDDGDVRNLDGQWPSSGQGFGRVNLDNSLFFTNDPANNWYMDVYRGDTTATGTACTASGGLAGADCTSFPASNSSATRQFHIHVEPGAPLDVTLAWTDAPGSLPAGADPLINNLNLVVNGPNGASYVGNNFNSRTTPSVAVAETPNQVAAPDTKNTTERIRVANPPAGDYTIQVTSQNIVTGNQGFALAAGGNISPFGGPAFIPGPALQVDQTGSPTISNVKATPVSNDTARVTFDTNEPTTAQLTTTPATTTFKDSYNVGNDAPNTGASPGLFGLNEGQVETSDDYANKLVVVSKHEILLTGLTKGTAYTLNLSASDLATPSANTTAGTASLTTPSLSFQADAPDIGQLYEDPQSATSSLWKTGTQMYASDDGGTGGAVGAFAFRMPTGAVIPADITGAYIELTSSHNWFNTYTADPILYVDLLPESVEANWGQPTEMYGDIHDAPFAARLNPETTHKVGAYQKYAFTFACSDLQKLKDSLTTLTGGNRMAAFRWDSTVEPVVGEFAQEFGFNRRSRGPDNRAKLVLYTGANQNPTGQACDPSTPAPTITDVGIHRGILNTGMVTVSWNTNVQSDSMVLFREQGTTPWIQVGSAARTTLHQVEVRGLDSSKHYEFAVRSATCNGLTTTDANGGQGYDFFYPLVQTATYYFHGAPDDQVQKTLNFPPYPPGSLTFDQSLPGDPAPVVQTATILGDPGGLESDTFSAIWIGGFPTGPINKDLTVQWYWSAANANPAFGQNLVIAAWDLDENSNVGTKIGEATVDLTLSQTPTLNKHVIHVNGTIAPGHKLLIQAAPFFLANGDQSQVYYDTAAQNSRFSYNLTDPVAGLPSAGPIPPPSANATNLVVPATRIGVANAADIAAGTGMCSISGPTAATIASFTGKASGRRRVTLTWRSVSEVDALGFNVWRFASNGARTKVNRTLVVAKAAGRTGGARYRLVDARVRPGRYTYRLQVVTGRGARVWLASTAVRAR